MAKEEKKKEKTFFFLKVVRVNEWKVEKKKKPGFFSIIRRWQLIDCSFWILYFHLSTVIILTISKFSVAFTAFLRLLIFLLLFLLRHHLHLSSFFHSSLFLEAVLFLVLFCYERNLNHFLYNIFYFFSDIYM